MSIVNPWDGYEEEVFGLSSPEVVLMEKNQLKVEKV
jgi:hypothetical protein